MELESIQVAHLAFLSHVLTCCEALPIPDIGEERSVLVPAGYDVIRPPRICDAQMFEHDNDQHCSHLRTRQSKNSSFIRPYGLTKCNVTANVIVCDPFRR